MAKSGPPSTVTPEQRSEFLELLTLGLAKADCYRALGLSRSAVVRACTADPDFGRQVAQAVVRGKGDLLRRVHAGGEDWRASAWMLERRWPAEFGRRNPQQFSAEDVLNLAMAIRSALLLFCPADRRDEADAGIEAALKEMRYKRWKPRRLIGAG